MMRIRNRGIRTAILASVFLLWTASQAAAVILCENVAGTPEPALDEFAARQAKYIYKFGPGGDDDLFIIRNGVIDAPGFTPDPVATHDIFITSRDATTEAIIHTVQIPPGAGWKATPNGWRYKDNTGANGGITHIFIKSDPQEADLYRVVRIKAKNAVLANVPFSDHDLGIHVMIEFVGGGDELCYGNPVPLCRSSGNGPRKQSCRL